MNPVTAFVALSAGSQLAGGIAAAASGMDEAARYESEARLADTQALQRDTLNRDELARFLSTVQAARSANGLSLNSPNAYVLEREAIESGDADRLRQRADDRQRASNFRAAAKSSRKTARLSLVTGIAGAGIPLAQYGIYKGW